MEIDVNKSILLFEKSIVALILSRRHSELRRLQRGDFLLFTSSSKLVLLPSKGKLLVDVSLSRRTLIKVGLH
ncbi:hypothetical protein V6N13_004815 [Hibiscus sabdariffa]|uniref:Uncharacterized protein n=1 Tax=Hibiscus sabdariffa TaxID=183260 RepID=A0ABR2S082_9ROSI